jgi:hypothetical protein
MQWWLAFVASAMVGATASADIVEREAVGFFKDAKNVELVTVDAVSADKVSATVKTVLRGTDKVGSRITFSRGSASPIGATLLYACGQEFCVSGIDDGGLIVLDAQFIPDASSVPPGVVLTSALPDLVAGRRPPDLCVHATVKYLDDTSHATIDAVVAAADGKGTATGKVLGAKPVPAGLFVGRGGTSNLHGAASSHLRIDTVTVLGGPPHLAADKCIVFDGYPVWPLARTPRMLERALAGKPTATTIARGMITIGTQQTPIELRTDAYGSIHWVCTLFAGEQPYFTYGPRAADSIHLPAKAGKDRYLAITPPGHAGAIAAAPEKDVALALLPLLGASAKPTWPVSEHGINDDGKVVGSISLVSVRDP